MSISRPFIERSVATTLLLAAVMLAAAISYTLLPVAALPQVDFPTIQVGAQLPGASPEVMAAGVATLPVTPVLFGPDLLHEEVDDAFERIKAKSPRNRRSKI